MPRGALRAFLKRYVVAGLMPIAGRMGGCCPQLDGTRRAEVQYAVPADGGSTDADCEAACLTNDPSWRTVVTCRFDPADGGASDGGEQRIVSCGGWMSCGPGGRRPAGLERPAEITGGDPVGRLFAGQAHLEAASVVAFRRLAGELAAHGLPRWMVQAALRAAGDEERHARVMGALAARRGATVPAVAIAPLDEPRALAALAVENAVVGCVEETWAAVVATWQARRAHGAEVRRALARIAADEAGHAELAWEVARALDGRLPAGARAEVLAARRAAVEELRVAVDREVDPRLVREAGLPGREVARAMLRDAVEALELDTM
jgi:hypothetical protein